MPVVFNDSVLKVSAHLISEPIPDLEAVSELPLLYTFFFSYHVTPISAKKWANFRQQNQTWNWTHQQLTVLHCLKRCWSICNLKKQNVDEWILIFTLKFHAEIYMYKRITAIFREYLYIGRDINHQIPYFGPNFTHFLRFEKKSKVWIE